MVALAVGGVLGALVGWDFCGARVTKTGYPLSATGYPLRWSPPNPRNWKRGFDRTIIMTSDRSKLKRPIHKMPESVREALETRGLMQAYEQRPAYQRNDYIGWITGAKRPATQRKRLEQMLDELEAGGVYMHMRHPPSRRR